MSHEIELKLRLSPDSAARLGRIPLLRSLARGRSRAQRLTSVYFDTPDLKLASNGMALRVRHIGARRIQALKSAVDATAGLHVYEEHEAEIATDAPDIARIDNGRLRKFLEAEDVAGQLRPVFSTEFDRRVWPLQMRDSEIELAFDSGEVRGGGGALPILEVELELKSGRPERLYELALGLHESIPFILETRSKSARGYALCGGARGEVRGARPVRLDPGWSADDTFVEIARNCLAQLRANEESARQGGSPEGIHQMRVAVRRMRALVGMFRNDLNHPAHAYLAEELRWLQRQLGPARDWDVFIGETLEPLHRRLGAELAVGSMLDEAEVLRDKAYTAAAAVLDAPRYTEFLLKVGMWLTGGGWAAPADARPGTAGAPIGAFARDTLHKRHKRMRSYGGKHAELGEAELHRLRILCKKARYAVEFFRELYPRKAVKRYHATLVEIQETLGSLNDAVVGRQLIPELERRMAASTPSLAPRAVGIVLGWQAARVEEDLRRFGEVWERFLEAEPFWQRA